MKELLELLAAAAVKVKEALIPKLQATRLEKQALADFVSASEEAIALFTLWDDWVKGQSALVKLFPLLDLCFSKEQGIDAVSCPMTTKAEGELLSPIKSQACFVDRFVAVVDVRVAVVLAF